MTDQVGDPKRDHTRLTSPGASQHQQRSRKYRYGFGLRTIESMSRVQSVRLIRPFEGRVRWEVRDPVESARYRKSSRSITGLAEPVAINTISPCCI